MTRAACIFLASMLLTPGFASETAYVGIDVPIVLDGYWYRPNGVLLRSATGPGVMLSLPEDVEISSLYRFPTGEWAFTPRVPVELDGTTYGPRDVVVYDGVTYTLALDGAALGFPEGAVIDALFATAGSVAVLSFDIPVEINGVAFSRSDLILPGDTPGLFWDASAAGVPDYANLVGADESDAGLVMTFDVPTELGGLDYFPGQLVLWTASAGFANFSFDPQWPLAVQLRDFSLLPTAGSVPGDGAGALLLGKSGPWLELSWGASCLADADYEVYRGTLGAFDSHVPVQCSTGGATTATVGPVAESTYFLVVPANLLGEGSYGVDGNGLERSPRPFACLPQAIGECPAP